MTRCITRRDVTHRGRPATKGARGAKAPGSNLAPPLKVSELLFILLYLVYVCPPFKIILPHHGCGVAPRRFSKIKVARKNGRIIKLKVPTLNLLLHTLSYNLPY